MLFFQFFENIKQRKKIFFLNFIIHIDVLHYFKPL